METRNDIKQFTDKDLDGMGCRFVLEQAFPNNMIHVTHVNAGLVEEKVLEFINSPDKELFGTVVITDLSVSKETTEKLLELYGDNLIIVDHHKTSSFLNDFNNKNIMSIPEKDGIKTSATSLLYELFLKDIIEENLKVVFDEFVELVRLYDTWDWYEQKVEKANQLNNLYYKLGLVRFYRTIGANMANKENPTIFTLREEIIAEMETIAYERFLKRTIKQLNIEEIKIGDVQYKYGFLLTSEYVSTVGNDVLNEVKEIDFIVMASTNGRVSLRSRQGLDVSEIAKTFFNGGGHPQASGGKVEVDLKEIMRLAVLNSFK